jgi:hypothetical protein
MINRERCRMRVKLPLVLLPLIVFSLVRAQYWIRLYDGPSHLRDELLDLALDPWGNVVVTGLTKIVVAQETVPFSLTMKYDPDGNCQWLRLQDINRGMSVACDSSGNVFVAGSKVNIKYRPDGDVVWVRNDRIFGSAVAVDRAGNAYVTGSIRDSITPIEEYAVTVKYGPDGKLQWMKVDSAGWWTVAIALDSSGNVYVAGNAPGPAYLVMKYNSDGQLLWRRGANLQGYGMSIAVAPGGDVYVTGSLGRGSYDAIATVKYSTDGEEQWVRIYNGPGWDWGYPVVIDNEGNCYVAGASGVQPGPWPQFDFVTIKYSPAGEELWVRRYDGGFNQDDVPHAIAVDSLKNVYVGGWDTPFQDTLGNYHAGYTLLKYDSMGNYLWRAIYTGPEGEGGEILAIEIGRDNNVYTAGVVFVDGNNVMRSTDACIIKYSPDGPGVAESGAGREGSLFALVPNPATRYFQVRGAVGLSVVRLYDIAGKLVRVYQAEQTGNRFALAGIPAGVYLVKLRTPVREISRKLVVR